MTTRTDFKRNGAACFIALEGLSGTGKTETAKKLASVLGGRFIRLTAGYEQPRSVLTHFDFVDARKCLFVSAMMCASVRIARELANGVSVVVDGYLPRTLAYHDGMGSVTTINTKGAILNPDYTFMLVCDSATRSNRIAKRARERTIWDEIEARNIEAIEQKYLSYNFPEIDTSKSSIEEVVFRIHSMICNEMNLGGPLVWR